MTISRLDRLEARVNKMDTDIHTIKNSLQGVNGSVHAIKESMEAFNDMARTVDKIWKWLKRGFPIVVTAAVSSGIVSGKWGDFFGALFH